MFTFSADLNFPDNPVYSLALLGKVTRPCCLCWPLKPVRSCFTLAHFVTQKPFRSSLMDTFPIADYSGQFLHNLTVQALFPTHSRDLSIKTILLEFLQNSPSPPPGHSNPTSGLNTSNFIYCFFTVSFTTPGLSLNFCIDIISLIWHILCCLLLIVFLYTYSAFSSNDKHQGRNHEITPIAVS